MGAEGDPGDVVLIVDDDVAIRETLELALQLDRHATALVPDGQAAMEWLDDHQAPCLILLDLMMPGMDGWQVLDRLRQDSRLAKVPVVVITAFNRDLGSASDCEVLRKPIELGDLLNVAKNHCYTSAG